MPGASENLGVIKVRLFAMILTALCLIPVTAHSQFVGPAWKDLVIKSPTKVSAGKFFTITLVAGSNFRGFCSLDKSKGFAYVRGVEIYKGKAQLRLLPIIPNAGWIHIECKPDSRSQDKSEYQGDFELHIKA